MKKLFLMMLLVCGATATSFAQSDWDVSYQGELNVGYATGGKLKMEFEGESEKMKTDFSRPLLETIHGVRVGDYLFGGVGVGVQYAYGVLSKEAEESAKWNTAMMPIFLNLKGYYPVTKNFAPYISLSLGATTVLASDANTSESNSGSRPGHDGLGIDKYNWSNSSETKLKGGFYCDFGVGFTARKFNFGLGLMHQGMKLTQKKEQYNNWTGVNEDSTETKMSITSFYVKLGLKF